MKYTLPVEVRESNDAEGFVKFLGNFLNNSNCHCWGCSITPGTPVRRGPLFTAWYLPKAGASTGSGCFVLSSQRKVALFWSRAGGVMIEERQSNSRPLNCTFLLLLWPCRVNIKIVVPLPWYHESSAFQL